MSEEKKRQLAREADTVAKMCESLEKLAASVILNQFGSGTLEFKVSNGTIQHYATNVEQQFRP